jgi:hypothetical protein
MKGGGAMRARTATIIFAIILFACSPAGVNGQLFFAYKCRPPGAPLEELKRASAVFVGRVKKASEEDRAMVFEFEVERYWKGAGGKVITVRSGKHLYGVRFTPRQRYLIYAYGKDELETSRCTLTKTFEAAAADLKQLGEGKVPE